MEALRVEVAVAASMGMIGVVLEEGGSCAARGGGGGASLAADG